MRKWRVGTLSMGVTLVLLGAIVFVSMWKGTAAYETLLMWWPVAFILLGLEILLYLLTIRKENSIIYYDVFSIFFVGFLSVVCVGFAFLASSGILQEIRSVVSVTEEMVELPLVQQEVNPAVKKIIVDAAAGAVKVDKTNVREVHVMGRYERLVNGSGASLAAPASAAGAPEGLVSVRTAGDIMYVAIRGPAVKRGLNSHYPMLSSTVVVPQDVEVEVRGAGKDGYKVASADK